MRLLVGIFALAFCRTERPMLTRVPKDSFILNRQNPAELECAGTNTETIQWKCNGKQVDDQNRIETFTETATNGQLITKSVLVVKNKQVEQYFGQEDYWCACIIRNRDNAFEKSKKAYIRIAYIDSKFQRPLPESGGVKLGEEFMLDCNPPSGVPKPTVTWFKDGEMIYIDDKKYQMTEGGDLIVLDVDRDAAGNYTCQARNIAGFRETPTANVWVYANGGWSSWSSWSACRLGRDQTCGVGVRERSRSCTEPAPLNGKPCRGSSQKKEECIHTCEKPWGGSFFSTVSEETGRDLDNETPDEDSDLIMVACLAGAVGIALVVFTAIFIYTRSRKNFNYLKKSDSSKKAPFNANHDFDLIRTQSQVTDARTSRKDGTLERLLYRDQMKQPLNYNPIFKDDFGTRSSSGVSTDQSDNTCRQATAPMKSAVHLNDPIYHSIIPPPHSAQQQPAPVAQPVVQPNQNYNSNYPTYAYPNPYKPR